jgi:hypothetical protein
MGREKISQRRILVGSKKSKVKSRKPIEVLKLSYNFDATLYA